MSTLHSIIELNKILPKVLQYLGPNKKAVSPQRLFINDNRKKIC